MEIFRRFFSGTNKAKPEGGEGEFVGEMVTREIHEQSQGDVLNDKVEVPLEPQSIEKKKIPPVLSDRTSGLEDKKGYWDAQKCDQRESSALKVLETMSDSEIFDALVSEEVDVRFFKLLVSDLYDIAVNPSFSSRRPSLASSYEPEKLRALSQRLWKIEKRFHDIRQ